jgi:hypothetical protein
MLEKIKVISQIEVTENGTLQIRESIRIMEDGNMLSESFHRYVLSPGEDLANQPANVVAIANAAWTPEIIANYQASQVANQN